MFHPAEIAPQIP